MSSQTGSRMTSYSETIEGLKKELEIYVTNMKAGTEWAEFERLYRALCTIEELAGAPKTTLEQLFDLVPANVLETPQNTESNSSLALGDQVERQNPPRRSKRGRKPAEESSSGSLGEVALSECDPRSEKPVSEKPTSTGLGRASVLSTSPFPRSPRLDDIP